MIFGGLETRSANQGVVLAQLGLSRTLDSIDSHICYKLPVHLKPRDYRCLEGFFCD